MRALDVQFKDAAVFNARVNNCLDQDFLVLTLSCSFRSIALFPKLIGTSELRDRDPIGTQLFVK